MKKTTLSVAVMAALVTGCTQLPDTTTVEAVPGNITRAGPDEFGVVCYSKVWNPDTLSCVQVMEGTAQNNAPAVEFK